MLVFDLDLNAWVRNPGSKEPPWFTPVVAVGQQAIFSVQFCRGLEIQNFASATWFAGMKLEGDFAGDYLASDNAPVARGDESVWFTMDLTTDDAKAYFTANPTKITCNAVLQVSATVDGVTTKTAPFLVVLQNDYLVDIPPVTP